MPKAKRRGAGEGSVFKRPDGTWVAVVGVGVDEQGRRRRRTVYGATRGEAVEKLDTLREQVASNTISDAGRMTVSAYLDAWLRDVAGPRVRPSTLRYYQRVLRPVREQLGGLALAKLSPLHLQAAMRADAEAGRRGPRGHQMTFTVLKGALRDAVRLRLLAHNPAEGVDRPRAPRPEIRALDAAQVRQLLAAAAGHEHEALYAIAVGTGLRLGEILGLRWGDADLDAGHLSVKRTLVEGAGGEPVLAEPKTARARRRVDLPAFVRDALLRHRHRLGAAPHPERLVFTDASGGPVRRPNLHRRSWKPLLRAAGLPDVPFHALRHTSASLSLAAGTSPKIVSERLGHATVAFTLDVYSHSVPGLGREAAERLDALLGSAG